MIQRIKRLAIYFILGIIVLSGCRNNSEEYKEEELPDNHISNGNQANGNQANGNQPSINSEDFRIIGYYPGWSNIRVSEEIIQRLSHINYAFLIPKENGTLHEIENPELLEWLVGVTHKYQVKLYISVGGWSFEDELLENVFANACNTTEKIELLVHQITQVVDQYDIDGVDVDWEYPRSQETSMEYETLMTMLRAEMDQRDKGLTAAVIGYDTVIGRGQTDQVLAMVDWINVMAYDADIINAHSSLSYMNQCIEYWKNERNVPADKLVIGVPFYSHPSRISYQTLIMSDIRSSLLDTCLYQRIWENYNGIYTIQNKAMMAKQQCGGIMFWEITQDAWDGDYSLIKKITDSIDSTDSLNSTDTPTRSDQTKSTN